MPQSCARSAALPFPSVLAQHKPLWGLHQASSPGDLVPPPTMGRLLLERSGVLGF